jgi:hypothetical protein
MALKPTFRDADRIGVFVELYMFEHDNMVGPGGNRCAGHDFNGLISRKLDARKLDWISSTDLAKDLQGFVRAQIGGVTGVTIADRAIERRLVAVGHHRPRQDPAKGVRERNGLRLAQIGKTKSGGVFTDFGFSF